MRGEGWGVIGERLVIRGAEGWGMWWVVTRGGETVTSAILISLCRCPSNSNTGTKMSVKVK